MEDNNLKQLFTQIYDNEVWSHEQKESKSGSGSTLRQTETIRDNISKLLTKLDIKSVLDAPCGDFNWMSHIKFPNECTYIGMDIVDSVILDNINKYNSSNKIFITGDICIDNIPKVDLIISRDCLVHLSFENSMKALRNFKNSGSQYLLTTSFPNHMKNLPNIHVGSSQYGLCGWQPLNLQIEPFNFPLPKLIINENCTESLDASDKSLMLWELSSLTI
jgi:SAM-dependent methyltransferase